MDMGISLCIPYRYQKPNGTVRLNIYRIADYEDGHYYPADPSLMSEVTEYYSPKFIRYRPGEQFMYYSPIIRRWNTIPKNDEYDKSTTESYAHHAVKFYEIVINPDYMGPDNDYTISCLREGITLPAGVSDTFLLAIDQDNQCYRTILCKKSFFKQIDNKYYIDGKLDDLLHAHHSLEVYYIDKDDVFDTSGFNYFFTETGEKAEIRSFYSYDELPEQDGELYLYRFDEYLPIYITKYLKAHAKDLELTKSTIQVATAAIKEALSNKRELEEFYAMAGYQPEHYEKMLPKYETTIIQHIDGTGFLNDLVTKVLVNSESLRSKYMDTAKKIWLANADADRTAAEARLAQLNTECQRVEARMSESEQRKTELEDQFKTLQTQYTDISAAMSTSLMDFDRRVGEHIIHSKILNHIMSVDGSKKNTADSATSTIIVSHAHEVAAQNAYRPSDVSKAMKMLERNLQAVGIESSYSAVLSNTFLALQPHYHSIIVSGMFARSIADAFSFSIDGHRAPRITVTTPNANYSEIINAIEAASGQVILIENLLDTCNEIIYSTLCKDFHDKILIFSVEDDSNICVLSKHIWTYGLFLNTDLFAMKYRSGQSFKPAVLPEGLVRMETTYTTDGYSDLMLTLSKFGLPVNAQKSFARTIAFLTDSCENVHPDKYIDAILGKFCQLYGGEMDSDVLDEIVENLPDSIKEMYHF